jgi:hypothetical protein
MANVHSKEVRSYNVSKIKGKDTKPELLVRKFLRRNSFRYNLHKKDFQRKPDIFMSKYKTIIFERIDKSSTEKSSIVIVSRSSPRLLPQNLQWWAVEYGSAVQKSNYQHDCRYSG